MSDADLWKQKTLDYGARIAALLTTDAQSYINGLIRTRFIEAPEFADALSDEKIKTLKDAAGILAADQSSQIAGRLTAASWLSADAADKDTPITGHPQVATAIAGLEAALQGYLDGHAFPPGEPVAYRLPARFIDGDTLPSLTRQYWRSLSEWRRLETEAAEVEATGQAAQRRSRWDDA